MELKTAPNYSRTLIRGLASRGPADFTVFDGKLYFRADDGVNGTELWVTDGTENGTELVKDIYPGGNSSNPRDLQSFKANSISEQTME